MVADPAVVRVLADSAGRRYLTRGTSQVDPNSRSTTSRIVASPWPILLGQLYFPVEDLQDIHLLTHGVRREERLFGAQTLLRDLERLEDARIPEVCPRLQDWR